MCFFKGYDMFIYFLNNVVVYFNDKVDGKYIIKMYLVVKILFSLLFKVICIVVEL